MYYLNASLRRLGLKEVAELPKAPPQPSLENITRFAFTIIDSDLFPAPSWLRFTEMIDERVADHALLLANTHRDNVEALDDVRVKISYFQATLDSRVPPMSPPGWAGGGGRIDNFGFLNGRGRGASGGTLKPVADIAA